MDGNIKNYKVPQSSLLGVSLHLVMVWALRTKLSNGKFSNRKMSRQET